MQFQHFFLLIVILLYCYSNFINIFIFFEKIEKIIYIKKSFLIAYNIYNIYNNDQSFKRTTEFTELYISAVWIGWDSLFVVPFFFFFSQRTRERGGARFIRFQEWYTMKNTPMRKEKPLHLPREQPIKPMVSNNHWKGTRGKIKLVDSLHQVMNTNWIT